MAEKGYVNNCFLVGREDGSPLFVGIDGSITPHLDGYAIVPIEKLNDPNTLRDLEQFSRACAEKNEVQ
jgi:hypothetical protein